MTKQPDERIEDSELDSQEVRPVPDEHVGEDRKPLISSRYAIIREVGSGGMGAVYLAQDSYLGKHVAIKVLHSNASGTSLARFQREARVSGKLTHPHIVHTYDFGLGESGNPYLVMELLEGESLSTYIARESPIDEEVAAVIFNRLCDALDYSHKKGVVHRDLKPSNVMLVENEQNLSDGLPVPKILDFGLAQFQDKDQSLTRTGIGLGTPAYMSPEQVRGEVADERSDVYSLGCILFEMLTGNKPFAEENSMKTMTAKLERKAPRLSDSLSQEVSDRTFSEGLETFVARCLSTEPQDRYSNAAHAKIAFNAIKSEEGDMELRSYEEALGRDAENKKLRSKLVFVAVVTGFLLSVVGIGVFAVDYNAKMEKNVEEAIKRDEKKVKPPEMFHPEVFEVVRPDSTQIKWRKKTGNDWIGWQALKDEDVKDINSAPKVRKLACDNSKISGIGFKDIDPKHLTELELTGCPLTLEGYEAISRMKKLTRLDLEVMKIPAEGLAYLRKLKTLEVLSLRDSWLNDGCFLQLALMKPVPKIDLRRAKGITSKGLDHLIKSKDVTSLEFGGKSFLPELAKTVSSSPFIDTLTISYIEDKEQVRKILEALQPTRNLKNIYLRDMVLPDDCGKLLSKFPSLRFVFMEDIDGLNDKILDSFATASQLKELSVNENMLTKAQFKALEKLTFLRKLHITVEDLSIEDKYEYARQLTSLKRALGSSHVDEHGKGRDTPFQ